jgi:hypothetical protein
MAYNPDDPYRPNLTESEIRRQARLDNELQADPELAEGPASGGKVAMFAIAIAVVLGAVFYGLNNSTINQAGTSSTAQSTAPSSSSGPTAMTPKSNTEPGTTTGAAPSSPQSPPSAAPTGQEVNRSATPPTDNAPNAPASK